MQRGVVRLGGWTGAVAMVGVAVVLGLGAPATAGQVADTSQPKTWSFTQAQVGDAQQRGFGGKGVVIAVVDGFVDETHPDFRVDPGGPGTASRVTTGANCRTGSCVRGSAPPDGCGHGTHVAGTIAGATYGIAPQATILPVTVLAQDTNGSCSGSPEAVAAGIIWAANHGAAIINVSLGDTNGPALLQGPAVTAAVRAAANTGALVVAAAGNNGNSAGAPNYGSNALIVAATGPDGQLASYSNRGFHVELAAPGGDAGSASCSPETCIASTWLDHGFALLSGTSMAAPVVSGTAALMLAANPRLSRTGLMSALESTAVPLPGTTAGLVDVNAAVSDALGIAPADSSSAPTPSSSPTKLVVPASRMPAVPTASPGGGHDGPDGPWQVALLLVIAMGIASGAALMNRSS